jgi:hypothetical protein
VVGGKRSAHSVSLVDIEFALAIIFFAGKALIAVFLSGMMSNTFAAENEEDTEQELPDLGFLEFLGQFETDSGEWIDPASLLNKEFIELLDLSTGTSEANSNAREDNVVKTNAVKTNVVKANTTNINDDDN